MTVRIGLTGGIGSGKSTVAAEFAACGAWLVDIDVISRALTEPGGDAVAAVAEVFGCDMIDSRGALDRERMRRLVFADPDAKQRLESLLHPLIGQRAEEQAAQAGARPVVFDVPLLAERPQWRERVQRVVVVDCSRATQVRRVIARSGWSAETVHRVIGQQATRQARRAVADAVIHNDEPMTLHALRTAARQLWQAWTLPTNAPVKQ